jgi:hypothetical protein
MTISFQRKRSGDETLKAKSHSDKIYFISELSRMQMIKIVVVPM